jgi:superfamily II DNA or RNA helicase
MLYDYQKQMKQRIEEAFSTLRSVMVQMPTGTGKTHLLAAVVNDYVQKDAQNIVWIIAHRRELVSQIENTIAWYQLPVSHENPESCQVRVYSIQWLSRHLQEIQDEPALIVIDEAHHALAKTYSTVMNAFPMAKNLGMTATPCRLNGKGFNDLFDTLLTSDALSDFIDQGYLSPYDYVSIPTESEEAQKIDSLEKRAADGDYSIAEMSQLLDVRPSIERLYNTIIEYVPNKKGIVYAIDIEHANHIAEYYTEKGLRAMAISSKTKDNDRVQYVKDFVSGKLQILVNVDIFSEGFDCPDAEFIQMARPTLSLAKYLQQVGRGLRVSKNKECCMLLDNVGLYRLFGFPTQTWDWQAMFYGKIKGKGEVNDNCIAYINRLYSSREISTNDNHTEMVVLCRHDNQQQITKLYELALRLKEKFSDMRELKTVGYLPDIMFMMMVSSQLIFNRQATSREAVNTG